MCFDFVQDGETIKQMFNNDFSLDGAELESFGFYDVSKIWLRFATKKIPKTVPDEWKMQKFNGISIVLTLSNIKKLSFQGRRVELDCSPIINKVDDGVIITIEHKNEFYLVCIAEVIDIESIEPYIDIRWR
ncbi:hypothetical protein BGI32_09595 [Snodgrassella alvi]|uniref:Immunity protein 50 n=1 Tax=Snodgrassella alvi TaxID=1196083 RepID=A0A2N9WS08_9NEIS|nr:Imm50 family immunity protein [Snodgrassella alvi]PIT13091.1 hypothetical protein BGI32_09595 [Snodgrassella alvi]